MSKNTTPGCEARQQSDQMSCHRCGLVWDMNDPEPPKCGRQPSSLGPELLIGETVVVDGIESGVVTGFTDFDGTLYFHLDGWRRPVEYSRCTVKV